MELNPIPASSRNFLFYISIQLLFLSVDGTVLRNSEQMTTGFIFSLPYDIANTLRAPLAGPLSLILTAGLALVMFFGLLISPVTYIFGYPSRNYYLHDAVKNPAWNSWGFDDNIRRRKRQQGFGGSDFVQDFDGEISNKSESFRVDAGSVKCPTFQQSIFTYIPNQDRECQLLLICHAHGFLSMAPDVVLRAYNFLSKRVIGIGQEHRKAIITGLEDQGECSNVFNDCTNDITTITRTSFKYILSQFMQIQGN